MSPVADPNAADSRLRPVPLAPLPDWAGLAAPPPTPPTSFVGRERDVAAIRALLQEDVRLLTLIGPGGVGKTRLAIRVAAELAPAFPAGVAFVGLAPLTDPALLLPTIAQTLGLRESGERLLGERLAASLGDRRFLLLLDNLEHLVDAAPQLAEPLSACPGLTLLVTSRVVLRLSGEHIYAISPLAVPVAARPLPLDDLTAYPAVTLFAQRARAADPAFALTAERAAVVGEIVRRLDGLPLAIELAATRVRSLSPAAMLTRLSDRLCLLTGGPRDQPARLQTMRDAIAWSHDLLDPAEQRLFRRLAVFTGGCTLEAATAVAGAGDPTSGDVIEGIGSLVNQSLLQMIESPSGSRYVMLETVRQFARERLQASGDLGPIERAHAAWCLGFAEAYAPWRLGTSPGPSDDRREAELDNLRAALAWAIGHSETETAQRIVAALHVFWAKTGRCREGLRWGERALALPGEAPPQVRALTLIAVSCLAVDNGDPAAARPLAEEGLAISRTLGEAAPEVWASFALAEIAEAEGDLDQEEAWHDRALALARALGTNRWVRRCLTNLGRAASLRGDHDRAIALMEESLRSARNSHDPQQSVTRA